MPNKSPYPLRRTEKLGGSRTGPAHWRHTALVRENVRQIKLNWWKGEADASGTIINNKKTPVVFNLDMSTALKKAMPCIPMEVVRIIQRDPVMRQRLSERIKKAARSEGVMRGLPSKEMKARKVAALNAGTLRGTVAKVVLFPYDGVEEVFPPEIIRGLAERGIKKRTLMHWSHSPQYINEQWRKLGLDKKQKK